MREFEEEGNVISVSDDRRGHTSAECLEDRSHGVAQHLGEFVIMSLKYWRSGTGLLVQLYKEKTKA